MKTLSLAIIILLTACGKPTTFERPDSGSIGKLVYWPSYKLPVTIKVPKEKFEKFKDIFEEVQQEYEVVAEQPLFKFISYNNNTILKNFSESKKIKGSNFLMFKEDDNNFLDLVSPTLGITQVLWFEPSMKIYQAHIVINFSKGEMETSLFKEVLLHELGHFLGFDHVKDEDSIMNEFIDHSYPGLRDFDEELIRKKYSKRPELAIH